MPISSSSYLSMASDQLLDAQWNCHTQEEHVDNPQDVPDPVFEPPKHVLIPSHVVRRLTLTPGESFTHHITATVTCNVLWDNGVETETGIGQKISLVQESEYDYIGQFNDCLVNPSQFYREYHGNRDIRKLYFLLSENAKK